MLQLARTVSDMSTMPQALSPADATRYDVPASRPRLVSARFAAALLSSFGALTSFYLLLSVEEVCVPPQYAAEMMAYDPTAGELRTHYAGFFDPGFGYEAGHPPSARAVLEVRSREVPFILEHGQTIGRLVFERLTDPPPEVYGERLGSNYQRQGLKLSKHFGSP